MLKDLGFNIIKQILNFSNYKISHKSKLYRYNGAEIKPFKSNDYLQVCLFDDSYNKHMETQGIS